MKLSRRALFLSFSVLLFAVAAHAQEKTPLRVSLVRLLASPEDYDGKILEVGGYLVLAGAETGGRLFVHRQDAENALLANSVRLERTSQMESEKTQLDGNYVTVVGVFRQGEGQKKGTGLLHEITSCRLVSQPPGAPAPPAGTAADEVAAVSDLRTLNKACVSYAVAYSIGYPAALSKLGPSRLLDKNGAGLIDGELAGGVKHGYAFTYVPGKVGPGGIASYTIHADPLVSGRTGPRHLFTNQTGAIRVNASARASASDSLYSEPAESAPAASSKSGRIQVSPEIQALKLIIQSPPRYPELARQARIQGTVRLRAVIAKDGTIEQLDAISGHPLLVSAAIDAVKQWRYAPTLVNGEPVEVETIINVVFSPKDNPLPI